MPFQIIIEQILALFLILFYGYFLRAKKIITKSNQDFLFKLLLDYVLPLLIISAMVVEIKPELITNVKILFITWALVYLLFILSASFFKRFLSADTTVKRTFEFLIIFSNVGYMGLPIIGAVYPEQGIFYGSLGMIPFNIIIWTYGVYLLKSRVQKTKSNFKNIFNHGIIAIIVGLFLFFTGLRFPAPVHKAIDLVGNSTFPLSMLIIGSSLYGISLKKVIIKPRLIFLSLLRLLIIPIFILLILINLPVPPMLAGIIVIQAAMPIAANSVIFAARYEGDLQLASEAVFLTTLLSLASIPLIIWLIQRLPELI
ncbi:MAG: AEC family transporter [Bacillota bacterium]